MKRDIANKMLFGVCAGLAKAIGVDALIIRAIALLLVLMGFGMPIIIYLVLAILTPAE